MTSFTADIRRRFGKPLLSGTTHPYHDGNIRSAEEVYITEDNFTDRS
jgi:hypothetical protein